MIKIAYICEPQVGGLYTFYGEMRRSLKPHGFDFHCIPPYDGKRYADTPYANDDGVDYLDLKGQDPVADAQTIVEHLVSEGFDAVLVLPGNSYASNLVPCLLPKGMGCAAKIPHNGRGVYGPTQRIQQYIERIAPVNDGLFSDLRDRYGIPSDKMRVVYIAVDTASFGPHEEAGASEPLRLGYIGRLEDLQKNVFLLPKILSELKTRGASFHLTIAGNGPDRAELEQRFRQAGLRKAVTFTGVLNRTEVRRMLCHTDVFLMPSRFEGCPHALIEAMASGCVPVVSRLKGILDNMVENGRSGYLCDLSSEREFAERIHSLATDPDLRRVMSARSVALAREKYDIAREAEIYAGVLNEAVSESWDKPAPLNAKDLGRMLEQRDWKARVSSCIPLPLKKRIRSIAARMGKSI